MIRGKVCIRTISKCKLPGTQFIKTLYGQSPMADRNKNPLRVARYEDLTNPELIGIIEGMRLDATGQHNEGLRTMMVCLDLEHFIATLDLNPAALTDNQREELLDLREQVFKITGQFVKLNILGEVGGRDSAEKLIDATTAARAGNVQAGNTVPKGS